MVERAFAKHEQRIRDGADNGFERSMDMARALDDTLAEIDALRAEVERLRESFFNAEKAACAWADIAAAEPLVSANVELQKQRDHHRETLRWLYRNLMKDAVVLDTELREREPWLFTPTKESDDV